jgi:hypothetical protein
MKTYIALLALAAVTVTGCSETSPAGPSAFAFERSAANAPSSTLIINTDEDYYCSSTVTGSFKNVFVREGATCTLESAVVSGNILAKQGARLFVHETTTDGNIDGVEAAILQVRGGRLEGSIQAQDGQSAGQTGIRIYGGTVLTQGNITIQKMNTGTLSITDAQLLKGNIQVQENRVGQRLELLRNRVAQNVEVFVNSGPGSKEVSGNTVQQKLSCKENTRPFVGGPNAAGDVEGQCRR